MNGTDTTPTEAPTADDYGDIDCLTTVCPCCGEYAEHPDCASCGYIFGDPVQAIRKAKLCSGHGQYHTDKRRPLNTINWQQITDLVDGPQGGVEKSTAQWLIPSTLLSRDFNQQDKDGQFWVLWFDADQNPHGVDALAAAVKSIVGNADFELYLTRSATPENHKARVLIPLLEPLSSAEWKLCQEVLNGLLDSRGFKPDRASERSGQLLYLPNRGRCYETRSRRGGNHFQPLLLWSEQFAVRRNELTQQDAAIQASRQAAQARRATIAADQYSDAIGAFNAAYNAEEVLERNGYARRGNTFRHPASESGSFSASVKDGRVHSLSTSDPLYTGGRGVGAHDAFSAFTILEHGGDRDAALRDAGDQWLSIGFESWNKVKQREHMQRQDAENLAGVDISGLLGKAAQAGNTEHQQAESEQTKTDSGNAQEQASAGNSGQQLWPELHDLVSRFEAQPYPVDALPDSIQKAVIEVQSCMKAPLPMVANSALSALSLAIQGFADVERASKLAGPCSLYTLTIANSGERKTTIDGLFMKPVREFEAEKRELLKADVMRYESDMEVFEAKKAGHKEAIKAQTKNGESTTFSELALHDLETKQKPQKPIIPRWIYSDATPEALANELVTNWPVGSLVSSEAGTVLGGAGMSKDSAMRNMARLNELWEGRVPATERVQSKSYSGTEVRFSVSLQVQEETVRAFFENTKGLARGTGFLARFLLAWPTSTMGTRMFTPPPEGWPCLGAFAARIKEILSQKLPVTDTGEVAPAMQRFSEDGKVAWVEFHDAVERELGIGGEMTDVRDVASKTADNAARLACLFHVFEGKQGGIDADCVGAASRIALWHLYEARRFLGEIAMPEELSNAARLESWMVDYCKQHGTDVVSPRTIQQCGPTSLRPKEKRDETLTTLVNLGRVRPIKDGKKIIVQLRPEVLEGVA